MQHHGNSRPDPDSPCPQPGANGTRLPRKPPTPLAQSQEGDAGDEQRNAIQAFEQILRAIPNDRSSLEALWSAYQQIGDCERAGEYLLRLARVLIEEKDFAAAVTLLPALRAVGSRDNDAGVLIAVIELAAATEYPKLVFNMADELSILWRLLEAGVILPQDYAVAVQILTDALANSSTATVSALQMLERICPAKVPACREFLSQSG